MKLIKKLLLIVNGEEKTNEMMSRIYLQKSADIMRRKITEVTLKDFFTNNPKEIGYDDPLFDTYCVTRFILDVHDQDREALSSYMTRYHYIFMNLYSDLKDAKKKKMLDNPMFLVDIQKKMSKPFQEMMNYSAQENIDPRLAA